MLNWFKLMLPVQTPSAKIFPFPFDPNHLHNVRRLVPHKGRIAIVTDARRDAMDASGATDERADLRTAKSCGPDASMVGVKLVKEISPMMVTKKPDHQGERGVSC